MEILFVSHKFPPSIGGMEKQSFELITGMERHCRVHRIVHDGSESLPLFFLRLRRRIIRLCRRNPGIRVVHFNDALLATFCLHHSGYEHLKRTVTLHGLDVVFPSSIYRKYILPRFNRFDSCIAVSQATADRASAFGIRKDKLTVIGNGVDPEPGRPRGLRPSDLLEKFGIPVGHRLLVAVGRPVKRKGFSWFLKEVVPMLTGPFFVLLIGPFDRQAGLFERILSVLPKAIQSKIMLFLGFGSDAAAIRTLLADPRLSGRVKHLGRLPADEKTRLLEMSDGFLMPNIAVDGDMEGFGLVCLEAVLAGAVVFASDIDGIPDAIRHGNNGFLVPPGNAGQWAAQLNSLLEDPQIFHSRKQAFRDYTLANYGWDKMVSGYFSLFQTLIQK